MDIKISQNELWLGEQIWELMYAPQRTPNLSQSDAWKVQGVLKGIKMFCSTIDGEDGGNLFGQSMPILFSMTQHFASGNRPATGHTITLKFLPSGPENNQAVTMKFSGSGIEKHTSIWCMNVCFDAMNVDIGSLFECFEKHIDLRLIY